jgi:cysteine-rich repeat protein
MTFARFVWVRAALAGSLVLSVQSCSVDERKPEVANGPLMVDPMGSAGSDGASGAASTGPGSEGGPNVMGLAPGASGAANGQNASGETGGEAGASPCVDGGSEQCGPDAEEGICKFGTRACSGGQWGECSGAVFPAARDCTSSADNDCDGQPDNTVDDVCRCAPGAMLVCDEHPEDGKGRCRPGNQACVLGADNASSDWGPCAGAVGPAGPDSCDIAGDDSNCDDTPNGGCTCVEGTQVACGPDTEEGICQRGTSTCRNGAFGPCQGAVPPARRDCASAQDNDCDGRPDNTPDGTCTCVVGNVQACGTHPGRDNVGPCRAGSQTCVASNQGSASSFGACQGAIGPAQRDSCTIFGDDSDCSGVANSGCQCVAGRGNAPCAGDPNNSRCNAQGQCAPCQSNADCSLVSAGRNLCSNGVCSAPRCGDGIVQAERGETCDDGNSVSGDGCSKICVSGRAPRGGTSFASSHMCAVLPNGLVNCWGLNFAGQLGTGSTSTGAASAASRVFAITTAVDVAILADSTCAALRDGSVSCWGSGFGARPVAVAGVANVTQVAGGDGLFCGRQSSGSVICWGTDAATQQPAGLSNIIQLVRGDRHACALRGDGTLLCAGGCSEGECGLGIFGDRQEAFTAATVVSNVIEVATGYRSTCVRTSASANVQCLGDRFTAGSPTAQPDGNVQPVTVLNLGNAVKIASGEQHMCALTADDAIKCWGTGLAVGNGDTNGSVTPVTVTLPGPAADVGAGSFTSCALLQDSTVYCWGNFAVTGSSPTPVRVTFQ